MKSDNYLNSVYEFHRAFKVPANIPAPTKKSVELRQELVAEEFREYREALADWYSAHALGFDDLARVNKAKALKELSDLLYVLFGDAVTFGLPITEAFNRVHLSNLSKLDKDGKPIFREDGKVLKGPNYKPADLSDLV